MNPTSTQSIINSAIPSGYNPSQNQTSMFTPTPVPQPSSAAVVNSKSASTDLANIKGQTNEIVSGIQNQSVKIANDRAQADAQAKLDADKATQAKLAADKMAIDRQTADAKTQALNGTTGAPVIGSIQYDIAHGLPIGTSSQADYKEKTTTIDTLDQAKIDRDKATQEFNDTAKNVYDTILNIQNGVVPLTPAEQAQVDGLRQSFQTMIANQELQNKTDVGLGNIRGYQKGAAEYDPTFQVKTIGSIITGGVNKVADLNIKMSSAVAQLTQSFKTGNIEATKDAFNVYKTASEKRLETLQKTIDETQKVIKEAQDAMTKKAEDYYTQVTKPIEDIAKEAAKNGADDATINAIYASKNVSDAVKASGTYLQTGSGIVGEYTFYKRQAEAMGLTPKSFDDYQTEDANRKVSIANATMGGGNLSSKEATIFNSLVDKFNKSPLVAAYDRTVVLRDVIKAVEADPSNGAKQLNLVYGYVQALDTYQSAVREGELALVNSIDSKVGKLGNYVTQITNGQIVRPEVAQQLADAAQALVDTIQRGAEQKQKTYEAQAKQNGQNVGDAFKSYIEAVNTTGSTVNNVIDKQRNATETVDDYYIKNPSERAFIDEMQDLEQTDEQIMDWLRRNNKISFSSVGSDTNTATRATRNNNPLNIKASPTTLAYEGVAGKDPKPASDGGQFLTFESPEAGFNAARKLLSANSYVNLTVNDAMKRWSGGGYGADVSDIPSNKKIKDLTKSELDKLIKDMARREGYTNNLS